MCKAQPKAQVQKATEVEQSTGFHLFELHLPSAGISIFTLAIIGMAILLGYCLYKRYAKKGPRKVKKSLNTNFDLVDKSPSADLAHSFREQLQAQHEWMQMGPLHRTSSFPTQMSLPMTSYAPPAVQFHRQMQPVHPLAAYTDRIETLPDTPTVPRGTLLQNHGTPRLLEHRRVETVPAAYLAPTQVLMEKQAVPNSTVDELP